MVRSSRLNVSLRVTKYAVIKLPRFTMKTRNTRKSFARLRQFFIRLTTPKQPDRLMISGACPVKTDAVVT